MIEVKNVYKTFRRKRVLENMSFTANKGEITCLIGINGAGKTTIMKAIMALTPIQKGAIFIDGQPVTSASYEKIAYIPDRLVMMPSYTITQAFEFMRSFYTCWNEERALELLAFFQLSMDDKIHTLSKGNTAKVNLLLGLALDVDYLLMDEPFSGIDIFSREQITEVFTSHLIENRGVLITTHEIQDIEQLIDKAIFIGDGTVLREINVEETRALEGKSVVDVMREVYGR